MAQPSGTEDATRPALETSREEAMLRAIMLRQVLLVIALIPLIACGQKIGDACERNPDCSTTEARHCDLSYTVVEKGRKKGECIIEDCVRGDCPEDEDSVCIQVYSTQFLSAACDPEREDTAPICGETGSCGSDGFCMGSDIACDPNDVDARVDVCAPHEVCLREGLCADQVGARNSCRRGCDDNEDCRQGYRCQQTDFNGIYVAPDPADPTLHKTARICVPDVTGIG
ncbi:MAG: hypothetical protein V3V08_02985 [Nannocystaceae bacterium]